MDRLLGNLNIWTQLEEDPSLDKLRLRIYVIAFPIGMAALVIVYLLDVIQGLASQFQLISQPLIALMASTAALIVWRRPQCLRIVERIVFILVMLLLTCRFYIIVYETAVAGHGRMFTTFPQWLPMIYFLAFLIFNTRQALIASLSFYSLLLAPALIIGVLNGMNSFAVFDLNTLIQIHLSHAIYIPLLSGIALLKAHYVRASARAEALAAIATVDYLTGAANRRHSELQLNQMIEQAQRYSNPLSIIFLDIDTFKRINDTHGHSIGDQVLIRLVELMRTHLRASDVCGRWGGEEFIIIAPETPLEQAILLADRLRALVAAESPDLIGRWTISLGVAQLQPHETMAAIIRRADQALYRAKQNGRNRVEADQA